MSGRGGWRLTARLVALVALLAATVSLVASPASADVKPSAPANYKTDAVSDTAATISWQSGGSGVGGTCPAMSYYVNVYRYKPEYGSVLNPAKEVAASEADAVTGRFSLTLTGLRPGTWHAVLVQASATCSDGENKYSAGLSGGFTTSGNPPPPTTPTPPPPPPTTTTTTSTTSTTLPVGVEEVDRTPDIDESQGGNTDDETPVKRPGRVRSPAVRQLTVTPSNDGTASVSWSHAPLGSEQTHGNRYRCDSLQPREYRYRVVEWADGARVAGTKIVDRSKIGGTSVSITDLTAGTQYAVQVWSKPAAPCKGWSPFRRVVWTQTGG